MKRKLINFVGAIVLIILFFQLWKISFEFDCPLSLLFPSAVLLVIGYSFIEMRLQRRDCFKECFFEKKSYISRILSNKIFIVIVYLIISIALTISTIYLMLDYTDTMIFLLIAYIVILAAFYNILLIVFRGTVRHKYLFLFSKEIAINISAVLSVFGYFFILLNSQQPSYLSEDLYETIQKASNMISSQCIYLDYILRLKSELDSIALWFVHTSITEVDKQLYRSTILVLFSMINALGILGINRFIMQIIYIQSIGTNEKES